MQIETHEFASRGGAAVRKSVFGKKQHAIRQAAVTQLQEAETAGITAKSVLQNSLEWAQAQFKHGEEEVAKLWHYNKRGHEVLSSLSTEYENQCNHYAQEVRVVSEANSSRTVKEFEERVETLMT